MARNIITTKDMQTKTDRKQTNKKQAFEPRYDPLLGCFNLTNTINYSRTPKGEMDHTLMNGQALPAWRSKLVTTHCIRQYRLPCYNGEIDLGRGLTISADDLDLVRANAKAGQATVKELLLLQSLEETDTDSIMGQQLIYPSHAGYGVRQKDIVTEVTDKRSFLKMMSKCQVTLNKAVMPKFWVADDNGTATFFDLGDEKIKRFREVKFPMFMNVPLESRKGARKACDVATALHSQFGKSTVYITVDTFDTVTTKDTNPIVATEYLRNENVEAFDLNVTTVTNLAALDKTGERFLA